VEVVAQIFHGHVRCQIGAHKFHKRIHETAAEGFDAPWLPSALGSYRWAASKFGKQQAEFSR